MMPRARGGAFIVILGNQHAKSRPDAIPVFRPFAVSAQVYNLTL